MIKYDKNLQKTGDPIRDKIIRKQELLNRVVNYETLGYTGLSDLPRKQKKQYTKAITNHQMQMSRLLP